MISVLFSLTVKISVLLIVALGVLPLCRARSAAFRHGLLLITVACALALPILEAVVPSWSVPVPSPSFAVARTLAADPGISDGDAVRTARETTLGVAAPRESSLSIEALEPVITTLWLLGVVVSLFALVVGLGRLWWLARGATLILDPRWTRILGEVAAGFALRRPVRVLHSSHPTLLAVWGWRTATVMVPPSALHWSEERVRLVLSHELAHAVRGDWLSQIGAEVMVAACWFNPLVWRLRGRLRLESERACDDAVLERGWAAADYATHLVDLAHTLAVSRRNIRGLPASAMARPAGLERRVTAMLRTDFDRRPLSRTSQLTIAVTLFSVTCGIAGAVLSAQTISSVVGTILDPTQRVLPGVQVVLTNTANHEVYKVWSDGSGRFTVPDVPEGVYQYQMMLPGFSSLSGSMTVSGNGKLETRATMQVATLEETVMTTSSGGPEPPTSPPARKERTFERRATPACPAATTIGGNIRVPRKLTHVAPIYPEMLSLAHVNGGAQLVATIDTDGNVRDIRTVSATHPEFEAAGKTAVSQWQFDTTLLNCQPIEVTMNVHLRFEIRP